MIRALRRAIALILTAALMPWPVFASGPGTTTGELLKIPVGTRAVGMGEAFTALSNDSSALYWNPAAMSTVIQKEASFMHTSLIESVHYENLGFVAPTDTFAYGTSMSYLGYGGISGYDNFGQETGDVNAYSYILNGGISRFVTDSISLGASIGYVHQSLADESARTFAATVGALYLMPTHPWDSDFRFAVAAQNLGPGMKFIDETDPLPRRIKAGMAIENLRRKPLNLTADVTMPNDNDIYPSFGGEYWFKDMVAVRLGYAGSNDEGRGVRVGFGLKYNSLLIDYAYAGFGDFGATNRLSLSFRFGDRIRQLNADERAILREAKLYEKESEFVPAILAYDELVDRDPTNEHIIHYMIDAHDKMAKQLVDEEVGERTVSVPIPSPEDAAMAELIPEGGESVAYAEASAFIESLGDDPLGLNKLPEVSTLDVGMNAPASALNTQLPPVKTPTVPQNTHSADPNGPALSPTDIYGN